MNEYIKSISLDLNCSDSRIFINAGQNDVGRKIKIRITADGEVFDLTNCMATLTGVKPDHTHLANKCDIEENHVIVTLTEQDLSANGWVMVRIILSDNTKVYSTSSFIINVTQSFEGDIPSTDEHSVLNQLLLIVQGKEDTANKVTFFDERYNDPDKFPTVMAVMKYLEDYYYTADEVDGKIPDSVGGVTEEDLANLKAELSQIETPTFVNSVDECTDTSKLHVLPDGYIYAYTTKTTTHIPTNLLKDAINTDGTPYNNGVGYVGSTTLHPTTGADYSSTSMHERQKTTGYIKCAYGDIIRTSGIDWSVSTGYRRLAFYDSSFAFLILYDIGSTTRPSLEPYIADGNLLCNTADLTSMSEDDKQKIAYVRFSQLDIGENSVVTINESTETTTETVTDWHNTNLAFVPADYEDRIIALENNRYSKSRHDGKVCVCFGDSIVANMAEPNDYPTVIANETGMTVYNVGFGGCRMSASMSTVYNAYSMVKLADAITTGDWTEQENGISSVNISHYASHIETLKSIDWNKVDFITIGYGTNDIANFVDVDNTEKPLDTTTVLGGLRYSLNTILTAYPHIKVLILTPIYRYFNNEGVDSNEKEWYEQRAFTTWTDGILDVAKEYGVPAVDMYRTLGFNKLTRNYYFPSNDGTHPNEIGLKVIGGKIAGKLLAEY